MGWREAPSAVTALSSDPAVIRPPSTLTPDRREDALACEPRTERPELKEPTETMASE